MSLKSIAALLFAKHATRQINNWASKPIQTQERVFKQLISTAKNTAFGKDHGFDKITSHQDFCQKGTHKRLRSITQLCRSCCSWRRRYIMARQAIVFCQNFWNNLWGQIHPFNQRIDANAH